MLSSLLRIFSIGACTLVVLGFAAFAADETGRGSDGQLSRLGSESAPAAVPGPEGERAREARNGPLRELLDDANDVLLDPFGGLVGSRSEWVGRAVPALLALLVYGLLVGILARWAESARMPRLSRAGTA